MRNTLQNPVSTDADPASKKTVPARTVASWKQNLQQALQVSVVLHTLEDPVRVESGFKQLKQTMAIVSNLITQKK